MKKLFYGVGINDISPVHCDGKELGFYSSWKRMLYRAYSKKFHQRQPTYSDVTVCSGWLTLSVFKAWFDDHYVEGYQMDKDIINPGCKHYSPENCRFMPSRLNTLTLDNKKKRGSLPQGVSIDASCGSFRARYKFNCKEVYLGNFKSSEEAGIVYLQAKREHILNEIKRYRESDPNVSKYSDALDALECRVLAGGIN